MKKRRLNWGLFKSIKLQQITSPLEILGNDTSSAALSTLLADQFGVSVIHIDGLNQNQLVINITNLLGDIIDIAQLPGFASSSNWNINLVFPNSKFYFYEAPTLDSLSGSNWELATDSNNGWIQNIYLANTGSGTTIKPGETIQLILDYGSIVPDDSKVISVQAVVQYQEMKTLGGASIQGATSPQNLDLMADAGRPSPLIGSFIGSASVLNDGVSKQNLTLQLVNTSQDPIQFIVPPNGDPTQSYIEVTLPVSDASGDALWALCNTSAFSAIQTSLQGSASAGWAVAVDTSSTGAFKLTPDFTKVQNIPPQGVIELVLTGVTSSLLPGVVQVQVSLIRVAIYGTQTFGVALEKTPLIYNSDLGSGMTLSGGTLGSNQALKVTGDSSSELVHLTQSGTGHALLVDGGDVTINNSLNVLSSTVNTVNIEGSSSNTVTISANGGTNASTQLLFKNSVNAWLMSTSENVENNQFSLTSSMSNAASLSLDDTGAVNITNNLGISNNITAGGELTAGAARIAGPSTQTTNPSLSLGGNGNFNVDAPNVIGGRFTVQDTTGNVGINIPNPQATLHVNGSTILNGAIQALGASQSLGAAGGTYIAPTDGYLIGWVGGTVNGGNVVASQTVIGCDGPGISASAQGGSTITWINGGSDISWNYSTLTNSCCIPISKGSQFSTSVWFWNQDGYIKAPTAFYWVPLGQGSLQMPEKIGDAPAIAEQHIPKIQVMRNRPTDIHDLDIKDLLEVLDEILGDNLNESKRIKLQDAVRRIVYFETKKYGK